jgi:hypothetical protein
MYFLTIYQCLNVLCLRFEALKTMADIATDEQKEDLAATPEILDFLLQLVRDAFAKTNRYLDTGLKFGTLGLIRGEI